MEKSAEKPDKKEPSQELIESLSPIELKILPYLNKPFKNITKLSNLDEVSVMRALKFLENKALLKLSQKSSKQIILGINGIYYKKNQLPERALLLTLEKNNYIALEEAKKLSKLSDNEFKAALGVLRDKAQINLAGGKISMNATKEELTKKSLEEQLIDILPINPDNLAPEQKLAFENLKKRKDIIEIEEKTEVIISLTDLGKKLAGREIKSTFLEKATPEIIRDWSRDKKFRRYDIQAPVPRIFPGKKHFVNQSIEHAKRIWLELGFKEMKSTITMTGFWNFDALFTAQDHPVREMQDTFFIKDIKGKLPDKKIVEAVKQAHERGISGSKGWQYQWKDEEAKKVLLRTHTTCLSAQTLASLRNLKNKTGKFFALGKCFRNETLDWSHGFEFNQTEGIVVDKDANFRNLLGYLQEFFAKMGYEKVKFLPSYFPYTEPSVEIYVWHKEKKVWLELGGAGIFRPEVVVPLLGEYIPVLAWGPGFDRTIMEYYGIKDLREMYENDIQKLREKRMWIK